MTRYACHLALSLVDGEVLYVGSYDRSPMKYGGVADRTVHDQPELPVKMFIQEGDYHSATFRMSVADAEQLATALKEAVEHARSPS